MAGAVTGNAFGNARRAAGVPLKASSGTGSSGSAASYPLTTSGFNLSDSPGSFSLKAGGHGVSYNGGSTALIRGTKSNRSGKFYIEGFVLGAIGSGTSSRAGFGVANAASTLTGAMGYDDGNSAGWWLQNGSNPVYYNNNNATAKQGSNGSVQGLAVDLTLGMMWPLVDGVPIYGDPVKGTGGYAPPTGALFIVAQAASQYDAAFVNTGQSPFFCTPPAGYGPWG